MPNPIQQGLKPERFDGGRWPVAAAMPNPIQQGLKPDVMLTAYRGGVRRNA